MKLWPWTLLALLGLCGAQRIAQDDAETVLELAASIKENIFNKLRQEDTTNASCILESLRDRKINVLQLQRLASGNSLSQISDRLCGLQDQWLTDIHNIQSELGESKLSQLTLRQKATVDLTCGNFPDAVSAALLKGDLAATKKLIIGLLSTLRYPIGTPDVITLFENAVKIIEQPHVSVEKFRTTGNDVVENLLLGVLSQNEMQPHENYQILELVSTLDNLRPMKEINLLLLMKPDSYPKDVIDARDKLITGVGYGGITGEASPGWPTPPQQLLSLLTSLTANPNDNEYVPYAHVVFGYFRLRYLTMMGYEFVPKSIADIAFLLNSFLTVQHPILIREIYFEFAKIPWQEYVTDIDYTQYSDPRVLFTDMLKAILRHPEALKLCNKLIFHYFLNNGACPDWLQVLPSDSETPRPVEVLPGNIPKPPPPLSKCPGEDVPVIDPACLLEIMADNSHAGFIADIIRYNPGTAERYPYNTREAVYQAILNDLKTEKYKDDEVNQFVISQAISRLPLNDSKKLPPVYISMCPSDISELNSHEPTPPVTDQPITSTSHYKSTDLGSDDEDAATEPDCEDGCKMVSVIQQQCLIDIITELRTNAVKNIVLLKPVLLEDYKQLDTREQVLKKVLTDREKELNDDIVHFIIPQAIERMKISWEGTLPPVVEEVCEGDLKYNITLPENEEEDEVLPTTPTGCVNAKTIDPSCLIEILSDIKNTKSVQKLILEEPILVSTYQEYSTRPGVLKAVVIDRCEQKGEWQLTYDVKKILARVPFNWKQTLPLEYLEECSSGTTASPESHISPSDIFHDTIPGLGEKPIPCESTTEMPYLHETDDSDQVDSKEVQSTESPPSNVIPTPNYKSNDQGMEDEELEDCEESASALGAGVAELGENPDSNGQTLGDQVLDSILGIVELPKSTKKKCKRKCKDGEVMTDVVKIESLWAALTPESPRAPYIRSKVRAFMVPIDRSKDYTKAEVLKDILLSVREDVRDVRVLQNVDQLIKCIRFEGPGVEPPETEAICMHGNLLAPVATEAPKPNCRKGEILVTVVQTDSLYSALLPTAPKTPYIRNRINGYIVPVDRSKIYTKGEVLRDILLSLKEDISDKRVVNNIDILLGQIRTDGPGLDEPEMSDVCMLESAIEESPTNHTPTTSVPSSEEKSNTDVPAATGADEKPNDNPNKPAAPEGESSASAVGESEPNGASPPSENLIATTEHPAVSEVPTQSNEDSSTVSSEATESPSEETTSPPPEQPSTQVPSENSSTDTSSAPTPGNAGNPVGELSELCPCPIDQALMKIIDISSVTNMLTDDHLPNKLSTLILPASNFTNLNRREVLEAMLTELMLKEHEVHAAMISCNDDGMDAPTIKYACVSARYAYEVPRDVFICPVKETEPPISLQGQCPCPEGQQYMQVINNLSVMDVLSAEDAHLEGRLSALVMPVAKYSNNDKKGALENALREILLRDYESDAVLLRCNQNATDQPQVVAACVPSSYGDIFPMDVVGCPEATTTVQPPQPAPAECHRPIDVLVPSSLLEAIYPQALEKASEMVEIILNSSLERFKYDSFGSRARIIEELLKEMKEVANKKLNAMVSSNEGDVAYVKKWMQQLDLLSSNVRFEGIGQEPPQIVNTCVVRPVDCTNFLCEQTTPRPSEDHAQLQNAIIEALQSPSTTPSPTGKRKVKKTHIIYTTKETINVNIQATKPTNEGTSASEDISKITDIMREEQKQGDERIAGQIDQALNITEKVVQQ